MHDVSLVSRWLRIPLELTWCNNGRCDIDFLWTTDIRILFRNDGARQDFTVIEISKEMLLRCLYKNERR